MTQNMRKLLLLQMVQEEPLSFPNDSEIVKIITNFQGG